MYIDEELLQSLIDRLAFHQTVVDLLDHRIAVDKCPLKIIAHKYTRRLCPVALSECRKFEKIIDLLISVFYIWCRDINIIQNLKFSTVRNDTDMSFVIFTCFQTGCIECESDIKILRNKCMLVEPQHIAAIIHHRFDDVVIRAVHREDTFVQSSRFYIQF